MTIIANSDGSGEHLMSSSVRVIILLGSNFLFLATGVEERIDGWRFLVVEVEVVEEVDI